MPKENNMANDHHADGQRAGAGKSTYKNPGPSFSDVWIGSKKDNAVKRDAAKDYSAGYKHGRKQKNS